jgi:hypothetical protein
MAADDVLSASPDARAHTLKKLVDLLAEVRCEERAACEAEYVDMRDIIGSIREARRVALDPASTVDQCVAAGVRWGNSVREYLTKHPAKPAASDPAS